MKKAKDMIPKTPADYERLRKTATPIADIRRAYQNGWQENDPNIIRFRNAEFLIGLSATEEQWDIFHGRKFMEEWRSGPFKPRTFTSVHVTLDFATDDVQFLRSFCMTLWGDCDYGDQSAPRIPMIRQKPRLVRSTSLNPDGSRDTRVIRADSVQMPSTPRHQFLNERQSSRAAAQWQRIGRIARPDIGESGWIEDFRFDVHPDREMLKWDMIADVFERSEARRQGAMRQSATLWAIIMLIEWTVDVESQTTLSEHAISELKKLITATPIPRSAWHPDVPADAIPVMGPPDDIGTDPEALTLFDAVKEIRLWDMYNGGECEILARREPSGPVLDLAADFGTAEPERAVKAVAATGGCDPEFFEGGLLPRWIGRNGNLCVECGNEATPPPCPGCGFSPAKPANPHFMEKLRQ